MAMLENAALDALLFDADGEELVDIKCFRGDRADVTAAEIRKQIHSAIMQHKMHPSIATSFAPNTGAEAIDMAELVGRLPVAA